MIVKLSWEDSIDLILSAKSKMVLIMPAIHEEWAVVIKQNGLLKPSNITICIDNSEEAIRSGYGNLSSINSLKEYGAAIKECEGLRISFICSDNVAYCLNIESRMIAGDPTGYNAIKLNAESAKDILYQFTPELFIQKEEPKFLIDLIKEEKESESTPPLFVGLPKSPKKSIAIPINEVKAEEVKKALKINPPESPDLKRKISTYTTLFQYAELHLEGGNITSKTISIPSDALPFKDQELKKRLRTSINLFTKETTSEWNEIHELRKQLDEIRKTFLTPCNLRKDKSILSKENKSEFQKKVNELKIETETKSKDLINKVQTAINNSEDTLRNELEAFFGVNPPDSAKNLDPENKRRQIDREITNILGKIKLPNANDLVSKIKLLDLYYELTHEDLNDKAFLDWFANKGLIDENNRDKIASFKNAYETKP